MIRQKRVLFISVHGDPLARLGSVQAGGQNVYVRQLAVALADLGWAVDVATHGAQQGLTPGITSLVPGVRVLRFSAGCPRNVPKDQLPDLIPAFTAELAAYLEQTGQVPRLIHSNYWISGQVGLHLKQRWGIPQVHTFHSLGKVRVQAVAGDRRRDSGNRLRTEQGLLDAVDAVLASNPVEARLLTEHYRVRENKLRILPCGINPDVFCPRPVAEARTQLGLTGDVLPVLFAGRLEDNKGPSVLIRAMAQVVREHPDLRSRVRLLIAGGSLPGGGTIQPEEEKVRSLVDQLGLADQVRFLGPLAQTDLAVHYAAAVTTVVPSFYETFGLVALEAMACGCPVVASRTGGLSHTVSHDRTGLLVPPGDVGALAGALGRLLRDPELVTRLRAPLRNGLPPSANWSSIADRAVSYYEEVAGEAIGSKPVAGH